MRLCVSVVCNYKSSQPYRQSIMSSPVSSTASDRELTEKLLRMVKREVKQIMEEAVTRKFVHEDSSSINSLCVAVDACLSNGLKRRALGLFKTNSTTALLQKVAKNCDAAAHVWKKVMEIENADPNKPSSSSESLTKTRLSFRMKAQPGPAIYSGSGSCASMNSSPKLVRYLWIRIALVEKYLASIVDHVVRNSSRYYEKDALVSDPVAGQILASLLVGPCALNFTNVKAQDQYWIDPPADELVQRHRISSLASSGSTAGAINNSTPPAGRKPLRLQYKKAGTIAANLSNGEEDISGSPITRNSSICWSPREYVESLHQNAKSTLLYGKNNVITQPTDDMEAMPGYLSLHQDSFGLIIKWTPNQLINGRGSQNSTDTPEAGSSFENKANQLWNHALNVNVENIVYLHCHQQPTSCGSIVMVGRDGVMHPPIIFPKGGHLLSFLSCLETGLVPYGQLDPPLWSEQGKGKIFPKLKRKGHGKEKADGEDDGEDLASDYVFRIISMVDKPDTISPEMLEPNITKNENKCKSKMEREEVPREVETESMQVDNVSMTSNGTSEDKAHDEKQHIQMLCDTMKRQIISRAFYGWLAYCRHSKTVRTHLAVLVNQTIIPIDKPCDAGRGLTKQLWNEARNTSGQITLPQNEFYRLIYYGGVERSIRPEVWPYLLDHYDYDFDKLARDKCDREMRQKYEMIMSEWLAVEAIVRQRDKEISAANLAKSSSESNPSSMEMQADKTAEVFEDILEVSQSESRKSSAPSVLNEGEKVTSEHDEEMGSENNSNSDTKHLSRKLVRHKQVESVTSFGDVKDVKGVKDVKDVNKQGAQNILITNPSVDQIAVNNNSMDTLDGMDDSALANDNSTCLPVVESAGSQCVSPASSNGGIYSAELLDLFSLNLHRIEKDVQRCDRNFWYFTKENLEKLRNVMCTYVWERLEDVGYVQGMCDLAAPLLVIFDDEVLTYSCFTKLMERMIANFPNGGAMDTHFANMRSLIQTLDADMFELMQNNGDYTHFYFCYRWFLLDFKRELIYSDVFSVWETIWAAKHIASSSFVLFIALALVEYYRDIILENAMDFTDIIKFFNEMAERHDAKAVLQIARDLVGQIQSSIDN